MKKKRIRGSWRNSSASLAPPAPGRPSALLDTRVGYRSGNLEPPAATRVGSSPLGESLLARRGAVHGIGWLWHARRRHTRPVQVTIAVHVP
jgi:hypothetical protein